MSRACMKYQSKTVGFFCIAQLLVAGSDFAFNSFSRDYKS